VPLLIDATQIGHQVVGKFEPCTGDRTVHGESVEDLNRLCR
jgi:hypothetical protein